MEGDIDAAERQVLGVANRTDNNIKNHFYSTLRRSLRRLNKVIGEKNSTLQMREIKPSVLTIILNFIYDHQEESPDSNQGFLKELKGTPPSPRFAQTHFRVRRVQTRQRQYGELDEGGQPQQNQLHL